MVKAGYVRHIGLSEVGVETIRRAAAVHPINRPANRVFADLARYRGRDPARVRERGIAITAYGVLSRGLISGHWQKGAASGRDFRAFSPRFQGDNVAANLALVEALRKSPRQRYQRGAGGDCLGGAQGADIVPVVGARRRDRLAEALGAIDVTLSPQTSPRSNAPTEGRSRRLRYAAAARPTSTARSEGWSAAVIAAAMVSRAACALAPSGPPPGPCRAGRRRPCRRALRRRGAPDRPR